MSEDVNGVHCKETKSDSDLLRSLGRFAGTRRGRPETVLPQDVPAFGILEQR